MLLGLICEPTQFEKKVRMVTLAVRERPAELVAAEWNAPGIA